MCAPIGGFADVRALPPPDRFAQGLEQAAASAPIAVNTRPDSMRTVTALSPAAGEYAWVRELAKAGGFNDLLRHRGHAAAIDAGGAAGRNIKRFSDVAARAYSVRLRV